MVYRKLSLLTPALSVRFWPIPVSASRWSRCRRADHDQLVLL